MRSLRKTTVAVVRAELELTLQEFADLIGKSPATVSSLENGRLRLSEKTALEISTQTGVSIAWLLSADPKSKPVNIDGGPWSKTDYERTSLKSVREFTAAVATARARLHAIIIEAIYSHQVHKDTQMARIVINRVERFLRDLADEFGVDEKMIQQALKYQTKPKNLTEFAQEVAKNLSEFGKEISTISAPTKTSSAAPSPSNERPKGGRKSA
jgi:transcriptional regulator with XRE-family HTH domain